LRQVISEINQEEVVPEDQNPIELGPETVHRARRQGDRRRPLVLPYLRVRLGEIVQIVNPVEHQQAEGEVIGATIGGYIRVRTDHGTIIRRFPINLRRLNNNE